MDAELIIIYRENPFFENFIKVTNEPNSVLAPGESHRGAWVIGGGGLFH